MASALSYTCEFNQAAFGSDPGVLAEVHSPGCNLAVWKGGASSIRESGYVRSLDLTTLGKGMKWSDGYYRHLIACDLSSPNSQSFLDRKVPRLNQYLKHRGFPKGDENFDDGRRQFAADLINLALHFCEAMDNRPVGFSLLLFRPRPFAFWHTDKDEARGIYTVKGDRGTLWRPNHTLPKSRPRDSSYWGKFRSEKPKNSESLNPEDVAVFRCQDMGDALVHATPPGLRLVATMGLLKKRLI